MIKVQTITLKEAALNWDEIEIPDELGENIRTELEQR